MESLPPIPTPPAQRWREFRIQVLPLLVFVAVLVAIGMLWRNFVQPSGMVGEVEAVKANVISLADGVVAVLSVERFDYVTNGQVIGQIETTAPEIIKASFATIQSDLTVMRARMKLDELRNQQSYQQLQLDLNQQTLLLDLAKVNALVASNTLNRTFMLNTSGVETPFVLDIDRAKFEALMEEIRVRTVAVANWQIALTNFAGISNPENDPIIQAAVKAKEDEVELTTKPALLKAPMDGVVSMIYRRSQEKVVKGEPIVTGSAPRAERIVGYIRQPVQIIPTTKDTVMVRTRTQKRQSGEAQILKVGAQFEAINPALLSLDSNRVEMGLPILISLPPGLTVPPANSSTSRSSTRSAKNADYVLAHQSISSRPVRFGYERGTHSFISRKCGEKRVTTSSRVVPKGGPSVSGIK